MSNKCKPISGFAAWVQQEMDKGTFPNSELSALGGRVVATTMPGSKRKPGKRASGPAVNVARMDEKVMHHHPGIS